MQNIIHAFVLGIIEGVTEFLPISSTGHLILFEDKLPLVGVQSETFIIAIQLGAILAIVTIYPEIFKKSLKHSEWFGKQNQLILLAISPALILGYLMHSTIKSVLFSPKTVAIGLGLGAILMIITDRFYSKGNETSSDLDLSTISGKQALQIGCAQCLALWPGMSRSASTIMGGLWSGLSYEKSAHFSFIIAVPVMVAAVSYDLIKTASSLSFADFELISIGFLSSFLTALIAVKTFLKLLSKFKLFPFALYRLLLVLVIFY